MKEIQLTKGHASLIDDEDYERVKAHSWYSQNSGYAMATIKGKKVLLHRFITNAPSGYEVDHINGDKLDNRRSNLRICTRQQNEANKKTNKSNTTGYKGVTFNKKAGKYKAQTYFMKKNIHLGYFETAEEAAKAYEKKARSLFGIFFRQ